MNIILKITKKEVDFLTKRGVKYGENGISKTVAGGKKATYYLTESVRNMRLHEKYLDKIIVK